MKGEDPASQPTGGLFFLSTFQTEASFYLGEHPLLHLPFPIFSFMPMLSVEFGGLPELARVVENYRDNINTLYGGQDRYTLALERVLRNIVVAMYSCYIDLWPVSGACCSHRSLLMYSMLEFAMLMGRYCRHERQFSQHRQVDPSDPLTYRRSTSQ